LETGHERADRGHEILGHALGEVSGLVAGEVGNGDGDHGERPRLTGVHRAHKPTGLTQGRISTKSLKCNSISGGSSGFKRQSALKFVAVTRRSGSPPRPR